MNKITFRLRVHLGYDDFDEPLFGCVIGQSWGTEDQARLFAERNLPSLYMSGRVRIVKSEEIQA